MTLLVVWGLASSMQGLSTLFTFWALFGSDIVIVSFPATTGELVFEAVCSQFILVCDRAHHLARFKWLEMI